MRLAVALALTLAPASRAQTGGGLHAQAARVFSAAEHEFVQLALPSGGPRDLTLEVVYQGRRRTLSLVRTPVRAGSFQVLAYQADGSLQPVTPEPELCYSGIIVGDPDSVVSASLDSQGMTAIVIEGGSIWRILPLRRLDPRASRRSHVVSAERDDLAGVPACGMGLTGDSGGGSGNGPTVSPPRTGATPEDASKVRCISQADIAFDCDYEYYVAQGGTVAATVSIVQAYVGLNNTMYARDLNIRHRLTAVVVRTAPFYFPVDGGDLLNLFRQEWNSTQWGIDRDLAHLMTGKPGSLIQYGGLAWVGVVCNKSIAYAWSMDSAGIVAHETGHNWGSGHCHDVYPCNNMCGSCLWVGPNTRDVILAYKEWVNCFWQSGSFEEPVPPYVYPMSRTLEKAQMVQQPAAFDVLNKAEDGNCEDVSLQTFDSTSALGVPIVLSVGTGPDGSDELIYSPVAPVLGLDSFTFTAGDTSGLTSVGTVSLSIPERPLEGYWPLTEGSGDDAADATGHGHTAQILGGATWSTGPYGGALTFDGVDDQVNISSVGVHGDEVTLSAWIKSNGPQTAWAGLIHTGANGEDAGLLIGPGGELRYVWAGDSATMVWASGLAPPVGQWVFVALVVSDDKAVIHMHDGVTLKRAVHKYTHSSQTFSGMTHLGWNSADETYRFAGDMADARVYGRVLGQSAVQDLVLLGGRAEAPDPRDGGSAGAPLLRWTSGVGAFAHHVYLGTDYDAVRQADQSAPEYKGSVSSSTFLPSGMAANATYYWRVDEETWGQTTKGRTWILQTPRYHHWPLDELSGTVAVDLGEGLDGGYKGGFLLGLPGATSNTGSAALLDGVNGRVRLPTLDLNDNHMTIAAWVQRNGDQPTWAGLVFCRGNNTAAGLCVGWSNELRFLWNGSGNVWDSQLVLPDNQWAFVAMVVEPSQTTLYMGDTAGNLTNAVRGTGSSPEEFDAVTLVGRDGTTGARVFKGLVDDVRILRSSLTPSQVQALYESML
ncbi:MAG: LamG-like jellyroll fold domain-containing protein [bacterium]